MSLAETLRWPFFNAGHRDFAERLSRWAADNLHKLPHDDVDEACRARVKALGEAGFLAPTVPAIYGGAHPQLDVRTLCLAREILGFHDGLADFAFAMQGLGTGSLTLYGTPELKERYLPNVGKGKSIAAFAISELEAGSDVAALKTTAEPDGNAYVRLNGNKTWISNAPIAELYLVYATVAPGTRSKGITSFVVEKGDPGFTPGRALPKASPSSMGKP